MKEHELITLLQAMPQDEEVAVVGHAQGDFWMAEPDVNSPGVTRLFDGVLLDNGKEYRDTRRPD